MFQLRSKIKTITKFSAKPKKFKNYREIRSLKEIETVNVENTACVLEERHIEYEDLSALHPG